MKFMFVDRIGSKSIWSIIEAIADRLLKEGHQVFFVFWDDGDRTVQPKVPPGVRLITIPVPRKRHSWDIVSQHLTFGKTFKIILKEIKPDVVHTHFAVPSIAARWLGHQERVSWIVSTQHEMFGSMRLHYRLGLRWTEKFCSAVTYVSNTVANSFGRQPDQLENVEKGRRPAQVMIPNGVDLGAIRETIQTAGERTPAKVVCAGRMVPVKGQELLLRALKMIAGDYPEVQVVLIGSGPMEKELRELARTLDLEKQVKFTGWLSQASVLREMASAGLVVVPSSKVQEGFGLVLAEAMVCRTSLLVSDIPLFHEVLDAFPGRGRFFTEGDVEGLAEELKKHMELAPEKKRLLPALTGIEEYKLSSKKMVDSYLTLYGNLRVFETVDNP